MADKIFQKRPDLLKKSFLFTLQLPDRVFQSVRNLYLAVFQIPSQLIVMIARNTECRTRADHPHHQPEHVRILRSPVAEIPHKYRPSPAGMPVNPVFPRFIAKLVKKLCQFIKTSVYISNDIKGSMLFFFITPKLCIDDLGILNLFFTVQHINKTEALLFELPHTGSESHKLGFQHRFRKPAVLPRQIPFPDHALRQVKDDRSRMYILRFCQL